MQIILDDSKSILLSKYQSACEHILHWLISTYFEITRGKLTVLVKAIWSTIRRFATLMYPSVINTCSKLTFPVPPFLSNFKLLFDFEVVIDKEWLDKYFSRNFEEDSKSIVDIFRNNSKQYGKSISSESLQKYVSLFTFSHDKRKTRPFGNNAFTPFAAQDANQKESSDNSFENQQMLYSSKYEMLFV